VSISWPSSRYVGHAARQKPQCTHDSTARAIGAPSGPWDSGWMECSKARRPSAIFSAEATRESARDVFFRRWWKCDVVWGWPAPVNGQGSRRRSPGCLRAVLRALDGGRFFRLAVCCKGTSRKDAKAQRGIASLNALRLRVTREPVFQQIPGQIAMRPCPRARRSSAARHFRFATSGLRREGARPFT